MSRLLRRLSGTSPSTMRRASPSTIAVLPTPGSPMSTGLFFVRRDSTWMTRRISSSRPMTGSSLPLAGVLGEVAPEPLERLVLLLGVLARDAVAAPHVLQRAEHRVVGDAEAAEEIADSAGDLASSRAAGARSRGSRRRGRRAARRRPRAPGTRRPRAAPAARSARRPGAARLSASSTRSRTTLADDPEALEHREDHALGLADQRGQQVLGRDLRVVAVAARAPGRRRAPRWSCG